MKAYSCYRLLCAGIISAASVASSTVAYAITSPSGGAFVSPGIITQVQQQGGTVVISGGNVTINAPGTLTLGTPSPIPTESTGCGACMNTSSSQPIGIGTVTLNVPVAPSGTVPLTPSVNNSALPAPAIGTLAQQEAQAIINGTRYPLSPQGPQTLGDLSPSAGGTGEHNQYSDANEALRNLGLGF